MPNTVKHWQRPLFIRLVCVLAVCLALGVFLSVRAKQFYSSANVRSHSDLEFDGGSGFASPTGPHPDLSPREVVQHQMVAVKAARDDARQIEGCYAFSSPGNRQMIGSAENLLSVIRENYSSMINSDSVEVGEAIILDRVATVLVTVIDADEDLHAYRFFLSRQTESPYKDCWMTDGVVQLEGIPIIQDTEPQPSATKAIEGAKSDDVNRK